MIKCFAVEMVKAPSLPVRSYSAKPYIDEGQPVYLNHGCATKGDLVYLFGVFYVNLRVSL